MHRLHRLPLAVVEQAVEILTGGLPLRLAAEARTEAVQELPQTLQQRAGRPSRHGPQRSGPAKKVQYHLGVRSQMPADQFDKVVEHVAGRDAQTRRRRGVYSEGSLASTRADAQWCG